MNLNTIQCHGIFFSVLIQCYMCRKAMLKSIFPISIFRIGSLANTYNVFHIGAHHIQFLSIANWPHTQSYYTPAEYNASKVRLGIAEQMRVIFDQSLQISFLSYQLDHVTAHCLHSYCQVVILLIEIFTSIMAHIIILFSFVHCTPSHHFLRYFNIKY